MLILGIDRDDASIQEIYDERNLAVLRAMSHVIRVCNEKGVTTSICGQAPSNYPEVVEFLVREGAVSMSVNPDKVIETKLLVAAIEQKLTNGVGADLLIVPISDERHDLPQAKWRELVVNGRIVGWLLDNAFDR